MRNWFHHLRQILPGRRHGRRPGYRPPTARPKPARLRFDELEARCLLSVAGQRLVAQTYEDLLRRPVDSPGLAAWGGLLDQGTAPAEVALRIEKSPECQTMHVQDLYNALLGRPAEPGGLNGFVSFLSSGGAVEQVKAVILGSQEYFQNRGGGTNAGFLTALYQDVVGRSVDPAGAAAFGATLAGGASRTAVAGQVLGSTEGRQALVQGYYRQYLRRDAESAGLDVWVAALQRGARQEEVIAGFAGSEEYRALVTRVDAVVDWNQTLLRAVRADRTPPPRASRNMAIVHAAVYDAVNAIDKTHRVYQVNAVAAAGASPEAAAAVAAHRVLVSLYPGQAALFDAQLTLSLSYIPDSTSKIDGIAVGRSVADGILTWRRDDGAGAAMPYTPGTAPGAWQPTPPGFAPALLPQWPRVVPFAMTGGAQFRPSGPLPALNSPAYAAALNEVKDVGRIDSTTRTADQTQIANFWADGPGTATPPGHWNQIAEDLVLRRGNSLAENARLFALLNIALADAAIASWDAKYAFDFWRPVTAIQKADGDGNPQTSSDPAWVPLLVTPPFPSYTSGHSTFSGAGGAVLTSFFGADVRFATGSDFLPGVFRSFSSFSAAADEAGLSRIYGGIHYSFDNVDGLAAGRSLGRYVFQNFLGGAR